jgi:hypothetical protein
MNEQKERKKFPEVDVFNTILSRFFPLEKDFNQ